MANSREGTPAWYAPDPRAVIPLDQFRLPKNTARHIRQNRFRVTADEAFYKVISHCARRRETWISEEIETAYRDLHDRRFAHSVEAWEGDELVGGLYGVSLGGAFFGESMFHTKSGASDVALAMLVEHIIACRFTLLDIQFINPHLERYGAIEMPRAQFEQALGHALHSGAYWRPFPAFETIGQ
jgi:leucyl/phenylalanyl-tRNA---protein transferase